MKWSKTLAYFAYGLTAALLMESNSHAEGLVEMTGFKDSERERVLLFDIVPVSRCMFGDYDLLLNDLQNARGDLALKLTVESMGDAKPIVWQGEPLKEKTDEKNVGTYRVSLPLPGTSRVLGVFLCSVDPNQEPDAPCSQQSLISFEQSFSPYHVDSEAAGNEGHASKPYRDPKRVKPKVYYAQFLATNNKKVAAFPLAPSRDHAAALKLFGVNSVALGDILGDTKDFSEVLSSLPLQSNDGRLQVLLPFFDDKKCNG
jgi:hypothetical protein